MFDIPNDINEAIPCPECPEDVRGVCQNPEDVLGHAHETAHYLTNLLRHIGVPRGITRLYEVNCALEDLGHQLTVKALADGRG